MTEELSLANTRATEFLSIAEGLFGAKVPTWRFEGVIFQDHPPHLNYMPFEGSVQISLSYRARDCHLQRDFQLAHEICHLLYPSAAPGCTEPPSSNVLNEGVSTYFSILMVSYLYSAEDAQQIIQDLHENNPEYYRAFELVSVLIDVDEAAIKSIRKVQPLINEVSAQDIQKSGLDIDPVLIEELVAKF